MSELQKRGWRKAEQTGFDSSFKFSQRFEIAISTDVAFELPPNFFDRIEEMPAVGGQVNQLQTRMSQKPFASGGTVMDGGIVHNDINRAGDIAGQQEG